MISPRRPWARATPGLTIELLSAAPPARTNVRRVRVRLGMCGIVATTAAGVKDSASAADDGWRGPAARRPQLGAPPGRRGLVHDGAGRVDHDTVVVARRGQADQLVGHIAQHPKRVALERIAPATGPWLVVDEDVAATHRRHRDLGRELALATVGDQAVARRLARRPTVQAVRTKRVAISAYLEHGLVLREPVGTANGHPAAMSAGPAHVGDQLTAQDLERLLSLGHLRGGQRHVREEVGVAVESVGPRPTAPGRADELHEDERRAVGVITADA